MKKSEALLFALLMVVLVSIELLCARAAYETLGEITSALYFLATGVNLIAILLAKRFPAIAVSCAIALALLIVPYQVILIDRPLANVAEGCHGGIAAA